MTSQRLDAEAVGAVPQAEQAELDTELQCRACLRHAAGDERGGPYCCAYRQRLFLKLHASTDLPVFAPPTKGDKS